MDAVGDVDKAVGIGRDRLTGQLSAIKESTQQLIRILFVAVHLLEGD